MDSTSLAHYIRSIPFRRLTGADGEPTNEFISGPVRLSFAFLAAPRKKQKGGEVYSATLLVPRGSDLTPAVALAAETAQARFGANWRALADMGALKMPLKDPGKPITQGKLIGRTRAEALPGFGDAMAYFDAETKFPVPVVSRHDPHLHLNPADRAQVYSGMWVIARCRAYAYPNPGAKGESTQGVNFGLTSLQKLCDDTEFAARDVTGEFAAIPDGPGAPAQTYAAPQSAPQTYAPPQQPAPPAQTYAQPPNGHAPAQLPRSASFY